MNRETIIRSIKRTIRTVWARPSPPSAAFDLWARTYDDEPNNLLLHLDDELVQAKISSLLLSGKVVLDVGCGTGRHWARWKQAGPARLLGCDVSSSMLGKLRTKHPEAEVYLVQDETLSSLDDHQCDLVVCNLVFGYFRDARKVLQEWDRVLKPGGEVLITDLHPFQMRNGAQRSFCQDGNTIQVKSYRHDVATLDALYRSLGWTCLDRKDVTIDERVRSFYVREQAQKIYESVKGQPILYLHHLRKPSS